MPSKREPSAKKTTNEKPISLYPLPLEEVVKDLFAVKPSPKDDRQAKKPSSNS